MIVETERLVIREFSMGDADLLYEYSKEKSAIRELPDEVLKSVGATEAQISFFQVKYKDIAYPLVYAVALKDTGVLIGHVSFSPIKEGVEIGYAISERYQGRGYASELVGSSTFWAKSALGLDKLYGVAKSGNIASWKVLEKSGYKLVYEGNRAWWHGQEFMTRLYVFS